MKFDSTNIFGVKCVTDGQTRSDSIRQVELTMMRNTYLDLKSLKKEKHTKGYQ